MIGQFSAVDLLRLSTLRGTKFAFSERYDEHPVIFTWKSHPDLWPALFALGPSIDVEKDSFCKLQYGPRVWLVRGIYPLIAKPSETFEIRYPIIQFLINKLETGSLDNVIQEFLLA